MSEQELKSGRPPKRFCQDLDLECILGEATEVLRYRSVVDGLTDVYHVIHRQRRAWLGWGGAHSQTHARACR